MPATQPAALTMLDTALAVVIDSPIGRVPGEGLFGYRLQGGGSMADLTFDAVIIGGGNKHISFFYL